MSKTQLDNKIKSVKSSVNDTRHKEIESTEEALKANANRFRAIFDQTAVGVAQIKTTTGNFVLVYIFRGVLLCHFLWITILCPQYFS